MVTGSSAPLLAGALLFAALLAPRRDLRAEIVVLAPHDGAVLASSPALLIARDQASGKGVEIALNGRALTPARVAGGFTAPLSLTPGRNRLELMQGSLRRVLELEYRAGARAGEAYRYHSPVAEGECEPCHARGGAAPGTEGGRCHGCHDRKDAAKFLHGPVGAGQCSVCHDPHGSSRPGLLAADERELCRGCHDQSRTRVHMDRSAGKRCAECHDPHGSAKRYVLR